MSSVRTSRTSASSPPLSGGIRLRLYDFSATLGIAVAGTLLAEWAARKELISPLILPRPSAVWQALLGGIESGTTLPHFMSTLLATLAGFALAAVVSLAIAALLASAPTLERISIPFIVAFQGLPKIAVAPLVILALGFGNTSKVVIVALICFFPILVNSLQGLRVRDHGMLDLMRSLGASRWQLLRYLRAPSAIPYIFAGLRVGVIFALIGAVVSEFVGARSGLGYAIMQAKAAFNVPGVFANLMWLTVIGLLLHYCVVAVESRVAFWARDVSAPASRV